MLNSLTIENVAIIEKAEIDLSDGLTVLTGETGAGKSIIIDALSAVLGERTSRELIRSGASSAKVTAVFSALSAEARDEISELGIECDDDTAVISRVIYSDGRNVCRINGAPATVAMLRRLGAKLVNIHGQHDSQALLQPEKHCGFIDSVAGNEELRKKYHDCFSRLVAVKKELEALYCDEDEKAARLDYLNYQIAELEAADIRPGEREELNQRKELCLNAKRIKKSYQLAYAALTGDDGEGGASDALQSCAEALESAAKLDRDAASAAETAKGLCYSLSDLVGEIRGLTESFDYDESSLTEIDERLDLLYRLGLKYGGDEAAMIANLEKMKEERDKIETSDKRAAELETELSGLSERLKTLAAKLTESRKKAGARFEKRVMEELSFLDMPSVKFVVSISPAPFSSKGADEVEFLLSANAGEEPRPLAKIASGGELSRIMLAIKNVISAKDDIGTLVFDEIDTGVSGRAAQKIAMKLREVSEGRQVICITHLAQIASYAGSHLKISKSVRGEKTYTVVEPLDFESRKKELARIMGGLTVTEAQLRTAEEMLASAGIQR